MRYQDHERLRNDAERVSKGVAANQSQESLEDQLEDLRLLATRFGLYDAADFIYDQILHQKQLIIDYGVESPTIWR